MFFNRALREIRRNPRLNQYRIDDACLLTTQVFLFISPDDLLEEDLRLNPATSVSCRVGVGYIN